MIEDWKEIQGYNGLYLVSNMGNVKNSKTQRILSQSENVVGVFYCNTHKKWVSRIRVKDKKIHLGYFEKETEAHYAYQKELKNIQAGLNANTHLRKTNVSTSFYYELRRNKTKSNG